jgi:hypothetical protein
MAFSANNNLVLAFEDDIRNLDVLDYKKLKYVPLKDDKKSFILANFNSKGEIKKEVLKPSDTYTLQMLDFINTINRSTFYAPFKEGKKMVIGKLAFYSKPTK